LHLALKVCALPGGKRGAHRAAGAAAPATAVPATASSRGGGESIPPQGALVPVCGSRCQEGRRRG
jgi:hypothetical protein